MVTAARDLVWKQGPFESRFADALLSPEPARERARRRVASDALTELLGHGARNVVPSELREGCMYCMYS
jgi:hypothetical protein